MGVRGGRGGRGGAVSQTHSHISSYTRRGCDAASLARQRHLANPNTPYMTSMSSSGVRRLVHNALTNLATTIRCFCVVILSITVVSSTTRSNMLLDGPLIDHVHIAIEDVINSVYAFLGSICKAML